MDFLEPDSSVISSQAGGWAKPDMGFNPCLFMCFYTRLSSMLLCRLYNQTIQ